MGNNGLLSPASTDALAQKRRTKIARSNDLIELAVSAQNALNFVNESTNLKLREIVEQMLVLKSRAEQVLEDAKRDAELHNASCNMVKKTGQVYYFYKKANGTKILSIISPSEWGPSYPHTFIGAYRLQADSSWAPIVMSDHDQKVDQLVLRLRSSEQPFFNALTGNNSLEL